MSNNEKTKILVQNICERFNSIFSTHTDEHNKVESHEVDFLVTSGDFTVDIECFNTITPYQMTIIEALFLANGYRMAKKRSFSWTATFDLVDVGVDSSYAGVMEYFKFKEVA